MNTPSALSTLRTQAGVIDPRRGCSPQGALLEMAMLEMERQRLNGETLRMQRRAAQIAQRTAEINRRRQQLQRFIDWPAPDRPATLPPFRPSPERNAPRQRRQTVGY